MGRQWYDDIPAQQTPNLVEQIVGRSFEVDIDYPDSGMRTVEEVLHTSVGVDSKGLFVCVDVVDQNGVKYRLYGDGTVCEPEDDGTVGSHDLAWVKA